MLPCWSCRQLPKRMTGNQQDGLITLIITAGGSQPPPPAPHAEHIK